MARTKAAIPKVGEEAPDFNLQSAQGGRLRLSLRTARGPVVVAFYRPWSEEDAEYFRALAKKEDDINLALGTIVGIGVAEPDEAREFWRKTGIKSYVLYDYTREWVPEWGLLERDREHGDYARPATFIVGKDRRIAHAWLEGRPSPEELFERVHEITGLPKPPEEQEEPPKKAGKEGEEKAPGGAGRAARGKPDSTDED